jgi:hypothetical protein
VQKTVWTAALSSGQEVPKQVVRDTAAHGLVKGTLVGDTLHWKLTFAKLTGPATAAHHPHGPKGEARADRRPALSGPGCLQEWRDRHGDDHPRADDGV